MNWTLGWRPNGTCKCMLCSRINIPAYKYVGLQLWLALVSEVHLVSKTVQCSRLSSTHLSASMCLNIIALIFAWIFCCGIHQQWMGDVRTSAVQSETKTQPSPALNTQTISFKLLQDYVHCQSTWLDWFKLITAEYARIYMQVPPVSSGFSVRIYFGIGLLKLNMWNNLWGYENILEFLQWAYTSVHTQHTCYTLWYMDCAVLYKL